MASGLQVIVVDPHGGQIDEVQALLDHLEARWSRFIPTSDLSRINAGAGTPVAVGAETIALVETMQRAWDLTQGRYDPTVLPVLVANGYAVSRTDPRRRTVLADGPRRLDAMGEVRVDRPGLTVTVPTGVALDPGGIGKGLAADLAVALLLDGGAAGALVGIGGDLAIGGDPPGPLGWPVDIQHPDPTGTPLCQVLVDHGGVATSSTRSRRWTQAGRARHHLVDPFTAAQAETDLATVTVFAATGWQAEAHATSALLTSASSVLDHLDGHGLTGLAVTRDGRILHTADLDGLRLPTPASAR
jgi:thiamine biosynthesis lipoprotein